MLSSERFTLHLSLDDRINSDHISVIGLEGFENTLFSQIKATKES